MSGRYAGMVHESVASSSWARGQIGAVLLAIVAGCAAEEAPASAVAAAPGSVLRPAGCAMTLCDAARTRCDETKSSGSVCRRCLDRCSALSSDIAFDCLDICRKTECDGGPAASSPCEYEQEACRRSDAERGCVDGIESSSYPNLDTSSIPPWKPPLSAHQGKCTEFQIGVFFDDCTSSGGCGEVAYDCETCIMRDHEKWPAYGAFVDGFVNAGGCVANVSDDSSPEGCGAKIFVHDACLQVACPGFDNTCRAVASASVCKTTHDGAAECRRRIEADPAYASCMVPDRSPTSLRRIVTHFCGKA